MMVCHWLFFLILRETCAQLYAYSSAYSILVWLYMSVFLSQGGNLSIWAHMFSLICAVYHAVEIYNMAATI